MSTQLNDFIPVEDKYIRKPSKYFKLSKIEDGETKTIRILSKPLIGWEDWKDKKPVRYKADEKPSRPNDESKPIKAFWALHIWDYETESPSILSITQASVISAFRNLVDKKGDCREYDVQIIKTGEGQSSRYTLIAGAKKPLDADVKEAISLHPVRLEALYEGKDPWKDLDANQDEIKAIGDDLHSQAQILIDHIAMNEVESKLMVPYLEFVKTKAPKPIDECVEVWLNKPTEFMKAYRKWLETETALQLKQKIL